MILTKRKKIILEWILVLMVINYMVVTIILHDLFLFKYLRDVLLIMMIGMVIISSKKSIRISYISFYTFGAIFITCLVIGMFKTSSISLMLLVARRYLYPFGLLFVISNIDFQDKEWLIYKFVFVFFALLALFGVFQAQILGDSFLRRLGYPVEYSYWYKKDMLYNSFYFGGFGIQRVVATLSSSNICGLVFGSALLCLLICNDYVKGVRYKKTCYVVLTFGYLLTFSRSNFFAMIVVVLILVWKYIPYKHYIIAGLVIMVIGIVVIGIAQGQSGLIYKLYKWVIASFQLTESSASGRSRIWETAFDQVLKSPFGVGLGRVGGISNNAGISDFRFSAENSYLALALDTGWIGAISYVSFMFLLISHLRKNAIKFKNFGDIKGNRICVSGYTVVIYLMIVMFFSNHIHDMEVMVFVYLFAGMAMSYIKFHRQIDQQLIG